MTMAEKNYMCDECDDTFQTEQDLREHKLMFHSFDASEEENEEESRSAVKKEQRPATRRAAAAPSRKPTSE
jgi:hypothetical protein